MPKSNSYKSADCCFNVDCFMLDSENNQPCWGQVSVVGEEYTEDDY